MKVVRKGKNGFKMLLLVVLCAGAFCCSERKNKTPKEEAGYGARNQAQFLPYISEYTSGAISKRSEILIRLTKKVDPSSPYFQEEELLQKLLRNEEGIKGRTSWRDGQTILFLPNTFFPSGTTIHFHFDFHPLFQAVPEDLGSFDFSVFVKKQKISVEVEDFELEEEAGRFYQTVNGIVRTADYAGNQEIEKSLTLKNYHGKQPEISWKHIGELEHRFTVRKLERQKKNYELKIECNGNTIGIDQREEVHVTVCATDFLYMGFQVYKNPEKFVDIRFSSNLDEKFDFSELIRVTGDEKPRFLVDGNCIRYYPGSGSENSLVIQISGELKNRKGETLGEPVELSVLFGQEKPMVRWAIDHGGVLPTTGGGVIPFEAVALKAVDVTIVEIYENNILWFLQENSGITGDSEVKRVGRPVFQGRVPLDRVKVSGKPVDLLQWNTFNLKLDDFVSFRPGALYQVRLNFRKSYSLFHLADSVFSEEDAEVESAFAEKEEYWDRGDTYYSYYSEDYDWRERDNPESNSYYGKWREIAMNVLFSNIGVIAKGNDTKELIVVVTDLTTASALSNAEVEVYNYQAQLLEKSITDKNGICRFVLEYSPYVVVVKSGRNRGYLRVDPSSSAGGALSVSSFDVGGSKETKGIKGFLYADRAVWRPGDTVYLYFMLEDKNNMLPLEHPVIFQLSDPKGKLSKRKVTTSHVGGIYDFTFQTLPSDLTGNWLASVRAGGEEFTKSLKIETIKPNRLKLNLDFGKDRLTSSDFPLNGNVKVAWLHGTVGKNLQVEYSVVLSPMTTSFPHYPNFSFDDLSVEMENEKLELFAGKTDENGQLPFRCKDAFIQRGPGMLSATFIGKAYEGSGDFSVDQFSLPYYPYETFVGIRTPEVTGGDSRQMLVTDRKHKFEVAAVDAQGKPVAEKEVHVEIFKLSWQWWWDENKTKSNFIDTTHRNLVHSQKVKIKNGLGEFEFSLAYPEWGRYYIRVMDPDSSHSAGKIVYFDWPGWAKSSKNGPGGETRLQFFVDKEEYQVGETARITLPAANVKQAKALVSVENGSQVLDLFWVDCGIDERNGKKQKEVLLPITPQMAPNVYLNITYLQAHNQEALGNDLPIRMYGIVPIRVVDSTTKLEPQIIMNDALAPEEKVEIRVKERNGKPMAYTVSVVDQGLLDITHFRTPDPWNWFYQKEALGIRTWDLYNEVIAPYRKTFRAALLEIGGGDSLPAPMVQKANRFQPVVRSFGPYFLPEGKTATHSFVMPNYIGSVRTMVVSGYEGKYGSAEKESLVKESLMVLATLPRVLRPGEQIKLPVNLFVLDDQVKQVKVSVKTEGNLFVKGKESLETSFEKEGEKFVYFDLQAKNAVGMGKVKITAEGEGGHRTSCEVEIDITAANPMIYDTASAVIEPGKTYVKEVSSFGIASTNQLTLDISLLPSIDLGKRMDYLIRYPHGCLEQVVSSVFPQLFLERLTDLTEEQKQRIDENIQSGIERIVKYRTASGGLAYWPGGEYPEVWATSYAGHFLIEAQKRGYHLPPGLLEEWKTFQKNRSDLWGQGEVRQDDMIQAYRLYTLALCAEPMLTAMNRLRESSSTLSLRAKWRLAAAYAAAGKKETAKEMLMGLPSEVENHAKTDETYGSALRDMAMVLETLQWIEDVTLGAEVFQKIVTQMNQEGYFSTQTTAYTLAALSRFAEAVGQKNEQNLSCSYRFQGKTQQTETNKKMMTLQLAENAGDYQGEVEIKNTGKSPLFVKVVNQGIPLNAQQKEEERILQMKIAYRDRNGNLLEDITSLAQGTEFQAEITVHNSGVLGELKDLALTYILPSGWEILNYRVNDLPEEGNTLLDYQDIRDDRVLSYFTLSSGETKTIKLGLHASYEGVYQFPPTLCESMYHLEAKSLKPGQIVSVKKGD